MKYKIKNLKEAAERVKQAAKNQERIIIYGDSDLDGIASAVILQEAIKNIGGQISAVVFPNREEDGYGINLKALAFLKPKAPALFITLDLGIGNVKEIALANDLGFEVLVIDHHLPAPELPPAAIIVDPQQPGDTSGMSYLCNAGLTYLLSCQMLGKAMSTQLENSLLELAALATISDMVPQIEENAVILEKGLRSLHSTLRPGLRALLDIIGPGEAATVGHSKIISYLNAAESLNFTNDAYALLTSHNAGQCRELAETLVSRTFLKQQKIKDIVAEVERRVAKKPDEPIIFEGDPAWKLILAGPVASIIASKYGKPTFIFKKMETDSAGSVRSLQEGQNSVEAMHSCADLLITYGGHPKASGFRLKNENLEKFKQSLIKHFER